MCNGSVKKKKKEFAKWLPMKPPQNISNSLNVLFTLKSQVDQNFIKDLMQFSFFFFFFFNEFVNRQKGKAQIH